jgi:predicted nucleic acid-binding protein
VTRVLVDSNVLLDVLTGDPTWSRWAAGSLEAAAEGSSLVINPIIYGEVSVHYTTREALDAALDHRLVREAVPYAAAFLAGKCFMAYRGRGGQRRSPLPDFYIGAHAAVAGYRLLTRDATRYRTYFPRLELIAPD